jgi:MFS family permease
LGDRIGRKVSFLVTITMMGLATTAIGLIGTYAQIGIAAPILLVLLRTIQGLAVGGQYSGAAVYVAEHAPTHRRGFTTGFLQTGPGFGFGLSMLAVLVTSGLTGEEAWVAWGWRVPFILSLGLLAISIWMRLKLSESPVFAAMSQAGATARHPLREAFATRARFGRVVAAMIGIAVGQSVAGYVGLIQAMNFLTTAVHMEPFSMRVILIASLAFGGMAS